MDRGSVIRFVFCCLKSHTFSLQYSAISISIMKGLATIVILLTIQGTTALSLRGRAQLMFNRTFNKAQRQLEEKETRGGGGSGNTYDHSDIMVRYPQS